MSSHKKSNTTLLQSRRTPRTLSSTESLHSFNSTIASNATFATPKSTVFELPPDKVAYNQYLQAMIKKQLVKNANEKHQQTINNQFKANLIKLVELQQTRENLQCKLEEVEENAVLTVQVNKLKALLSQVEEMFAKHKSSDNVRVLKQFLEVSLERVQLKNVKPIESQQEFDELVDQLTRLNPLLKSIVSKQGDKIADLKEVARDVDELKGLQKEIGQLTEKITRMKEKSIFSLLEFLSNNFNAKYKL